MNMKIFNSSFFSNVLIVASGSIVAQILPLVASPVLTTMYSQEVFGKLAIFLSVCGLLTVFFNLKYEQAIVIAEDENERKAVFQGLFINSIILFFILEVIVVFLGSLGYDLARYYLNWIPITSLLMSANFVFIQCFNRQKKFKVNALVKIVLWVLIVLFQLCLANYTDKGLVFGYVIGYAVIYIFCIYVYGVNQFQGVNPLHIKKAIRKHKNFPKYAAPNYLINTFSINIPSLFLGLIFNFELAGIYFLASRIVSGPVALVAFSISQVFYQRCAELYADGKNVSFLVSKIQVLIFCIFITPMILSYMYIIDIFLMFFDESWLETVDIIKFMIPWFFMVLVNVPLGGVINVLGMQKQNLKIEILLLILRLFSFLIGYIIQDGLVGVMLFCYSGLLTNILLFVYVRKRLNNEC